MALALAPGFSAAAGKVDDAIAYRKACHKAFKTR